MEQSHNLVLNEEALAQLTEAKRPLFIFEWLRHLDKALVNIQKVTSINLIFDLISTSIHFLGRNKGCSKETC